MGGNTKVESKIGVGTKFIINTKVKCRKNPTQENQCLIKKKSSKDSENIQDKYVFISKDSKETELKIMYTKE